MKNYVVSALCAGLLCGIVPAKAERLPSVDDKYKITDQEIAACGDDAKALCSSAYPDEDKLVECMKQNRTRLSGACRPVFEAGIRRRHL